MTWVSEWSLALCLRREVGMSEDKVRASMRAMRMQRYLEDVAGNREKGTTGEASQAQADEVLQPWHEPGTEPEYLQDPAEKVSVPSRDRAGLSIGRPTPCTDHPSPAACCACSSSATTLPDASTRTSASSSTCSPPSRRRRSAAGTASRAGPPRRPLAARSQQPRGARGGRRSAWAVSPGLAQRLSGRAHCLRGRHVRGRRRCERW